MFFTFLIALQNISDLTLIDLNNKIYDLMYFTLNKIYQ